MSFNSLAFLIYLPIVILVYWLLPHKVRWVWLLIASYYFYMSWNPWLVFLILGTTVVSYLASLMIERTESKKGKKAWLIITLVVCLGILGFFKYFNFLLDSVISVIRLIVPTIQSYALDIILPVGISFYTFQTLSYVIDVYRGKFKAEHHFGYYALFVSYFPQLVAGPIERPENLLTQLKEEHHFNTEDFCAGTKILLSGFFRKVVIADFLSIYVTNCFNNLDTANSLAVILAGTLFAFQIYCDFAGYSEIATGSARLMGVKLSMNFDRPYLACSYTEFFRRWHMTLNQWFMDYLYIPLGGNRKGTARKILNLWIVFALCGLWHGAKWNYVLWGLHGAVFETIEALMHKPFKKWCEKRNIDYKKNFWVKLLGRINLAWIVIFSCLLFRATTLSQVAQCYSIVFTSFSGGLSFFSNAFATLGLNWESSIIVLLMLGAMCLVYFFAYSKPRPYEGVSEALVQAKPRIISSLFAQDMVTICLLVLTIAICWFSLMAGNSSSAFAYFQF